MNITNFFNTQFSIMGPLFTKETFITPEISFDSKINRIETIAQENILQEQVERLEQLEERFISKSNIEKGDPFQGIFFLDKLIVEILKMNRQALKIQDSAILQRYIKEIDILADQIIEPWIDDFGKKIEQEVGYLKQLLKNEKFAKTAVYQLKILSIHLEKNRDYALKLLGNISSSSNSLEKIKDYLEGFLQSLSVYQDQITKELQGTSIESVNDQYGSKEWKRLVKERPNLSQGNSWDQLWRNIPSNFKETMSKVNGLFYIYLLFSGQFSSSIKPSMKGIFKQNENSNFNEREVLQEKGLPMLPNLDPLVQTSAAPRLGGGLLSFTNHLFNLITLSPTFFLAPLSVEGRKMQWNAGEEEAKRLYSLFTHVEENEKISLDVCKNNICHTTLKDLNKIKNFKAPKSDEEEDAYGRTLFRLMHAAIIPSTRELPEPSTMAPLTFLKLLVWSTSNSVQDMFINYFPEKIKNPVIKLSDFISIESKNRYLEDFGNDLKEIYITNPDLFYQIAGDVAVLSMHSRSEKVVRFGKNLIKILLDIKESYPLIEEIAFKCLKEHSKEVKIYGALLITNLIEKDYEFRIKIQDLSQKKGVI